MSTHNRSTIALCLAIAMLTLGGILILRHQHPSGAGSEPAEVAAAGTQKPPPKGSVSQAVNGAGVQGLPVPAKIELAVEGEAPPAVSVILDVNNPAKVVAAVRTNTWLQTELKEPLGRGFLGGWAGFLGTRGEDVKARFSGLVVDYLADHLLGSAFRVVWFSGDGATGTPAVVIPGPSEDVRSAFAAVSAVAQRGVTVAHACPGVTAAPDQLPRKSIDAGGADGGGLDIEIQRWVLADQPLYAALDREHMVLGRNPLAVLEGLCAKLPAVQPTAGADLEVSLAPEGLGHEALLLTSLLGLGGSPHVALAVQGQAIVPVGLSGALAAVGRLDVAPTSLELLKLVPEDLPVLATFQLKLPAKLDKASLKAFLAAKGGGGGLVTREVALLWNPRGDPSLHSEVALVWSRPEDAPELRAAFSGSNHLQSATVCGHLVLSGSPDWLTRIRRSCDGQAPSMANAGQAVLAGLQTPQSVGVSVQVGRMLSQLTADGWVSDGHAAQPNQPAAPMPPEVLTARHQLEELPLMGFFGVAQSAQLIPGGFHS